MDGLLSLLWLTLYSLLLPCLEEICFLPSLVGACLSRSSNFGEVPIVGSSWRSLCVYRRSRHVFSRWMLLLTIVFVGAKKWDAKSEDIKCLNPRISLSNSSVSVVHYTVTRIVEISYIPFLKAGVRILDIRRQPLHWFIGAIAWLLGSQWNKAFLKQLNSVRRVGGRKLLAARNAF